MPDYVLDRGAPFISPISAERAREIFEGEAAEPDAEREGTLEEGFTFVSERDGETQLMRTRVRPVKDVRPVDAELSPGAP